MNHRMDRSILTVTAFSIFEGKGIDLRISGKSFWRKNLFQPVLIRFNVSIFPVNPSHRQFHDMNGSVDI